MRSRGYHFERWRDYSLRTMYKNITVSPKNDSRRIEKNRRICTSGFKPSTLVLPMNRRRTSRNIVFSLFAAVVGSAELLVQAALVLVRRAHEEFIGTADATWNSPIVPLVSGCGRSGTHTIGEILLSLGITAQHEGAAENAVSVSW
jgi:hypothetical protein